MKISPLFLPLLFLPFALQAQLKASKFMFLQSPGERTKAHGIVSSNDKYGIENLDNYLDTEFIYQQLYYLPNHQLYLAKKDRYWGIVDKEEKVVIPFQYREFRKTVQQYYVVEKENKFGVLDTDLNTIIPVQYEDLHCYKLDRCLAKKEGKWGVIDGEGKTIVPHEYHDIKYSKEGTYLASMKYEWGVISEANEILMPFQFREIRHLGGDSYLGREGRSWVMTDEKGTKISELKIDQIQFGGIDKLIIFRSGRKWGIIGENGQVLLEALYEKINWFLLNDQYQIASVKDQGKYGLFSLTDGWIDPIQYDQIRKLSPDGLRYIVTLNQKQGLKENGKKTLLDIEYLKINGFRIEENYFLEVKNKEGFLGIFDEEGKMIIPMEYTSIKRLILPTGDFNGLLLLKKGATSSVFDLKKRNFVIEKEKEIKHLEYNYFAVRDDQWRLVLLDSQLYSKEVYDDIQVFKDKTDDYFGRVPTRFYKVKKLQKQENKKLKPTYGLIDAKGNEVLPAEFNSFTFIHGHLILCMKEGKCGFYDLNQNTFLGLAYTQVYATKNGIIVIRELEGKQKKYGLLDKTGQVVLPIQYDRLEQHSDYIVAILNGKYGLLDASGKEQWPFEFDGLKPRSDLNLIFVKEQKKWGIRNLNGQQLLEPILDEPRLEKENPIPFQREGKYGYLNYLAQEIIPCQYDYAAPFFEQMAIIGKDQLFGVTNLKHELLLPIVYDTIVRRSFDENLIVAQREQTMHRLKWGLFNSKGEKLLPIAYDTIWWEYENKTYVVGQNGQYGLFGKRGNELIPIQYEKLSVFDRMIYVHQNGKEGLFNMRGQQLIPCKYDHIQTTYDYEGNYVVGLKGKYGLYNVSSQVKTPIIYEKVQSLGSRAFQLKQGNQWKLWVLSDNRVVEEGYDSLAVYGRNHFRAKKESGWGIIDKTGKVLLPFDYDEIGRFHSRSKNFPKGMAKIVKAGQQGYVLEDGRFFIPPKYQEIRAFAEGMARFRFNDLWGFLDERGTEAIAAQYESAEPFEHGLSKVQLNGKPFYIDKSGKCQKNCED